MPRLGRQRHRAKVRAPRHSHQQCRHPQIREGRRGERGELERDPRRQPDELRLLRQGGGSANAPQPGRRHRSSTASVRSVVAGGGNVQYDTTKAAIAGLTRALAADHSPDGIRVNAVGPGPIFTPFHQRRIAAAGETVEQYNAKAAQGTMLKRPGRAEDGRRRDPVFGLRRCLLRHRRPALRGRRYDCAVRNKPHADL